MATGKTFHLCLEVLLDRATFSEEPKNYTISAVSNIVVEVEDRMKGSFTMAVYSEAYVRDGILASGA